MRSFAPRLVALGLVLAFASAARASPSARLYYARGPGAEACPDEAVVRRLVAEQLGYDPFFVWAGQSVTAAIGAGPKGLHAEVELVDENGRLRGRRAMDAPSDDCEDLVGAMALAISLAIDPLAPAPPARSAETLPPPSPPALAPPAPSRPGASPGAPRDQAVELSSTAEPDGVPAAPEGSPPRARTRDLQVNLGVGAGLSNGTAPSPPSNLAVYGEVTRERASLGLEVRADFPASGPLAGGGTLRTSLDVVTVAPCYRPLGPVVVCALASAGILGASSLGLVNEASPTAFFAAFGGRVGLEVPIQDRVYARVHGDVEANATRHVVVVDGASAFRVAPFSAIGGFELGVRF